tara:strand:+ start:240 stop:707 length:468 start_codon:yes stop_codon:yes gene_type:complete
MYFKILLFILIFIFNYSCSLNKVVKHHGVHYLEKKQKKLVILEDNSNDVRQFLGPPSTKNYFDNDIWVYIERKTTVSNLSSLGKRRILTNNVLVLEFDSRGTLVKKNFYDKDQMNKIKISENKTSVLNKKDTFINSILVGLRQKINDPLGKRTAR